MKNIFFDTDFTLVGTDGSLRPYVREVFQALNDHGFTVYMWSGARVPWDIVTVWELGHLVRHCYFKPIDDPRREVYTLQIPWPHYCIDDNTGPIEAFGGYVVPPFLYPDAPDDHLLRAYRDIARTFNVEPAL